MATKTMRVNKRPMDDTSDEDDEIIFMEADPNQKEPKTPIMVSSNAPKSPPSFKDKPKAAPLQQEAKEAPKETQKPGKEEEEETKEAPKEESVKEPDTTTIATATATDASGIAIGSTLQIGDVYYSVVSMQTYIKCRQLAGSETAGFPNEIVLNKKQLDSIKVLPPDAIPAIEVTAPSKPAEVVEEKETAKKVEKKEDIELSAADLMKQMEYRLLGGTGLKVSTLALGTMSFTSLEQATEMISTVRKYGVNTFDCAEAYGKVMGEAEILFGKALKQLQAKDPVLYRRSDLVITTKFFFGPGSEPSRRIVNSPENFGKVGKNEGGLSRKKLLESIAGSLERLQLDYVDIVFAHRYDPSTPMEEIVRGFNQIIRSGKAHYWATSMWPNYRIVEAYWVAKINKLIPPVAEQPVYNMFNREHVEVNYKPLYEAPYRIGTTIWSPLDSGLLTGKYVKDIPKDSRLAKGNWLGKYWGNENHIKQEKMEKVVKLMEIAEELGVSMVWLAIGWTIKNKNVSCALLGGSRASQLENCIEAITAAKKLDGEMLKRIEEILDNKPK